MIIDMFSLVTRLNVGICHIIKETITFLNIFDLKFKNKTYFDKLKEFTLHYSMIQANDTGLKYPCGIKPLTTKERGILQSNPYIDNIRGSHQRLRGLTVWLFKSAKERRDRISALCKS